MPWDWLKINREDPKPVSDYPDYLDYPQFVRRRSFWAVLRRSLCLTRERYQQVQRAQRAQRLVETFGNLRYNAHKFGLPCIFVPRGLQCLISVRWLVDLLTSYRIIPHCYALLMFLCADLVFVRRFLRGTSQSDGLDCVVNFCSEMVSTILS